MKSLALLLCAAVPATAQVEVRLSAPAFAPSLAVPAAASSLAAPAFAPSFAPAPSLAAPAFAPALAPAASPAASISAALTEFSKVDLKAVPAAAASDAGETLMARALGAAPSAAAASVPVAEPPSSAGLPVLAPSSPAPSPSGPRTYLLSKPMRETVRLGPLALVFHALYGLAWEVAKAALAWHATGHIGAALAVFAVESPTSPLMMSARSLGHLGFKYWRRKLTALKDLAKSPEIRRVRVLTAGEISFKGPLAKSKDNTGFLFVDADAPPVVDEERFGTAIPLGDLSNERVRLTYGDDSFTATTVWTPTLQDLLDGQPIPAEIAKAWREARPTGAFRHPSLPSVKSFTTASKIRVEASLIQPDGSLRPIGTLVEGPPARALVGMGMRDRARAWLGFSRAPRAIPLSDSRIARPDDAPLPFWTRAWRRMTGRLIVPR